MSGFDEARGTGGGGRSSRGARSKASASGFDAVGQSAGGGTAAPGAVGSYQGGDSAYTSFRDGVERDLRKLTALAAATRTQVEKLGGKADGMELRKRM